MEGLMREFCAAVAICVGVLGTSTTAQSIGERETANTLRAPAGAAGPPATLEAMKWLVGHWTGTGLGGVCGGLWAEPAGGVMMGRYWLVISGKPSFYEFIHLAEEQVAGDEAQTLQRRPDGVGGEGAVRDVPAGEDWPRRGLLRWTDDAAIGEPAADLPRAQGQGRQGAR